MNRRGLPHRYRQRKGYSTSPILQVGAKRKLWRGRAICLFEDADDEWGSRPGERWSTAFSAYLENGAELPTIRDQQFKVRPDRPDGNRSKGRGDGNELTAPGPGVRPTPVPWSPNSAPSQMLNFRLAADRQRPELRISN